MKQGPPAHEPADDTGLVWGAYLRLSRLKPKRKRGRQRTADESVQRQLMLIRAHAAEHGLNLPEHLVFSDNGRSGWQRPGGPPPHRPEWDRMLQAGKAGMFGGLLVWKLDRFARNVRDGEDLIDLGVLLDGPESGRIDSRTAYGAAAIREKFVTAQHASDLTSERVKDAFADMLASGYRIGGSGRLFGLEVLSDTEIDWDWDGDDLDARITGPAAVYRNDEAEVVRQWAAMLLAGETSAAMCAYATDRGFTTTRGGKWNERNLARTLGNPIYGGRLTYKGEEIGRLANVEPILDEQTYLDVQAKLGARKQGRKAIGMHLLTGALHCGNPECPRRGTMNGFIRWENGRRRYVCPRRGEVPGCGMTIAAEPVEAIVRDEVIRLANDPDLQAEMQHADTAVSEERAALAELLDALDRDLAATEAKAARVPYTATRARTQIERNVETILARFEETERKLTELGEVSRHGLRVPPITAEEWDDPHGLTPAERAEYIRRLGRVVTILPSKRPQGASRRPFEEWRVVVTEVEPKPHP
jgi:DNA invertase Pin-like site-specific DNA recombinase